ncbi:hypothetical protein [Embleya hyalina]|uniref:hypothetical protein n=1 Tax=Embleya hyalina TaxID=516124 RepID=UPI000F824EF1|nr:hypothetical protein [Embleya hyalina]
MDLEAALAHLFNNAPLEPESTSNEAEGPLQRAATTAAAQRELGDVLHQDVLDASAAGHSWREIAAVVRMPVATLFKTVAAGRPLSVVSTGRGTR